MKKSIKNILALFLIACIVISTITVIYAEAIYYYFGYRYTFINNDKVSLYGVDEDMTDIVIPEKLNGRAVVDIRNRAFQDNTTISNVDFTKSSNLERIGSFAFAGCINLVGEITIPDTVITIESAAFQDCTSLESVIFNASTGNVPNQCFSGCTTLNNVILSDSVTEIGFNAFTNCINLTYLEIPKTVTSISSYAFQNDTNITLGVYRNSYALEYAESNGINYIILDPEPTEPPTEPEPTEPPTEAPTEPVTEAPTTEPTQMPTELSGYYLGDVNSDGIVDVIDATLLQRHLAYIMIPSEYSVLHGDVDSDGSVSIIDVTFISRYVAKADVIYPVGEWQSTT